MAGQLGMLGAGIILWIVVIIIILIIIYRYRRYNKF